MAQYQGVYYDMTTDEYHADPCPEPSLSASIAETIWRESPNHARNEHPRLNPNFEQTNKKMFDLGSAAHAVLLENSLDSFVIIKADDYRTKAAQQKRDDAYMKGLIPILEKDVAEVLIMASTANTFLADTELSDIFTDGNPEVTILEFSDGFWKRGRLDWLTGDRRIILDYKTGAGSSKPQAWIRQQLFSRNCDIQAHLYRYINWKTGGPKDASFIWLVQENKKPYACSLVGASPAVLASGKEKWRYSAHKWKWCLEFNKWPSHDNRIHWAEPPSWTMAEVEERKNSDE